MGIRPPIPFCWKPHPINGPRGSNWRGRIPRVAGSCPGFLALFMQERKGLVAFAGTVKMKIRAGYKISYDCPQPTPMIITLSVHPGRRADLVTEDALYADPALAPNIEYVDGFGNICHVVQAPAGKLSISSDFIIRDGGEPDVVAPEAKQQPMEALPVDTLVYLMGSRYCETDKLSQAAWDLFGNTRPAGRACRPCAISSISTSSLTISRRNRPEQRSKPSRSESESAAISRISPSRCAAR